MTPRVETLRRRPDDRSFERLYRRHLPEVYRFVLRDVGNRADAEEVTQSAFLDAYRALRRGHAPEKPRAWLFGIAKNATRRRYRTLSRRPFEVELEHEVAESMADEERPQLDELRDVIGSLRPAHQQVLFLREIEGLSYVEIANRMDLSHAAVETLLFRARRSLRELLEEEGIRPAAAAPRTRRFAGLAFLPAGLLRQLDRVALEAERAGIAVKTAAATAAVIVGAGITVAVVPLQAAGEREQTGTMPKATTIPAADADLFTSVFSTSADPGNDLVGTGPENPANSASGPGGNNGGEGDALAGLPGLGAPAGPVIGSGLGLPGASVPPISTPVGSTPPVSAPPISTPPVSTPPLSTPPVSTPPLSIPPVSTPPVSTPPVSTPPISTPPISTPPVSIPPLTAPAVPEVEVPDLPDAPAPPGLP